MQATLDRGYSPSMVFFTWAGFDEMDGVTGDGKAARNLILSSIRSLDMPAVERPTHLEMGRRGNTAPHPCPWLVPPTLGGGSLVFLL
jgi:hypothetical protein